MKTLILIRGLPGSGKTTLAKNMSGCDSATTFHFEADQYFYKDGVYRFNPSKLKDAHELCQYNTSLMLRSYNDVTVIVANTFTTLKEMDYYFNLDFDRLQIIDVQKQFKSVHGVPEETIKKMKDRWSSKQDVLNFFIYLPKINIEYEEKF